MSSWSLVVAKMQVRSVFGRALFGEIIVWVGLCPCGVGARTVLTMSWTVVLAEARGFWQRCSSWTRSVLDRALFLGRLLRRVGLRWHGVWRSQC